MIEIAKENWTESAYRTVVIKGLEAKLDPKTTGTKFTIFKKNGNILAFMRFDRLKDGDLYAGSLNIPPALRGSAIGEAFLKTCIEQEGRNHAIHADFFPEIDAGMMYVERLGWMITGIEEVGVNEKKPPVRRCKIAWDQKVQPQLSSRESNVTKEYLMSLAETDGGRYVVKRFHFPQDQKRFLDTIEQVTSKHMVASRYFSDPSDTNTRYLVFEELPVPSVERLAA